jgi:hypothetical protein
LETICAPSAALAKAFAQAIAADMGISPVVIGNALRLLRDAA